MTKKYLYGNLNQDVVKPNYGGSTTDSLKIYVDNDNMIISGEVNWDSALGELAHKAYPGDKGARNYKKILELSYLLEKEIEIASQSRNSVESKVGYIEKFVQEQTTALTELIQLQATTFQTADKELLTVCVNEIERAIKVESDLLQELRNESTSRQEVDNEFKLKLDTLSNSLKRDLDVIDSIINAECLRAQDAEELLKTQLESEVLRSLTAEDTLDTKIDELENRFTTTLQAIQNSLINESSVRKQEDSKLQQLLINEEQRAIEVEKNISSRLSDVENSVVELPKNIISLQSSIQQHNSEINQLNESVSEVESKIDNIANTISTNSEQVEKKIEELNKSVEDEIDVLSNNLEAMDTQLNRSTAMTEHHAQTIDGIQNTLSDTQEKIKKLEVIQSQESLTRQQSIDEINSQLERESEIRSKEDITIHNNIDNILTRIESIRVETANLTIQTANLDLSVKALENDSSEINNNFYAELTKVNTVLTNIEKEIETTLDEVSRLESVTLESRNDIDSALSLVAAVSMRLSVCEDSVKIINNTITELQNNTANLDDTLERIDSRVEEALIKLTSLDIALSREIKEREDREKELSTSIQAVDNQLAITSQTLTVLQKNQNKQDQLIQELEEYRNSSSNQFSELDAKISNTDKELFEISAVVKDLDNTLSDIDTDHELRLLEHDIQLYDHKEAIEILKGNIVKLNLTDSEITQQIDIIEEELKKEVELHRSHYNTLVEKLLNEIDRSIDRDTFLNSEVERNSNRITSLQIDLTNVISTCVDELREANQRLEDRVTQEEQQLVLYKQKTDSDIADVLQGSIDRDTFLQTQIEELKNTNDRVPLIPNDGTSARVYAQQGDTTLTILVDEQPHSSALVKRDLVGNILVNTNKEMFSAYSAVSRHFVETLINELREELKSVKYDFIDGGKAPVD